MAPSSKRTRASDPSSSSSPSVSTAKKSSQPSRKSKASWRKNIDMKDIDEHMESVRVAERLGMPKPGAAESDSQQDSGLFAVDTQGDDAVRQRLNAKGKKKKPMKSLQALENTSAVKPVTSRKGTHSQQNSAGMYGTKAKATGKLSKAEQDRLRRIASRPVKGVFGAIVESEQGNALESIKGSVLRVPDTDAWQPSQSTTTTDEVKVPLHLQKRQRLSANMAIKDEASQSKQLQPHQSNDDREYTNQNARNAKLPLHMPTTGHSYNPTASSHKSLLQEAYEIEKSKMDTEEKERAFKEMWKRAAEIARQSDDSNAAGGENQRFAGMIIGQGDEDSSSEDEEEEDEEEEEESSTLGKSSDPVRKTREQKKKAARAKAEADALRSRREAKSLRHHLSQLPTLQKQLKRQRAQQLLEAQSKRSTKLSKLQSDGLTGSRIGKYKIPKDFLSSDLKNSVQLEEELSEGLRGVKPQGNLFKDTWNSMVVQGKAEYRRPISDVGKGRRKRGSNRVKEYETHAYKRFE
ncbi:unnamed protein product [Sympodiomycopsis kandeliae]